MFLDGDLLNPTSKSAKTVQMEIGQLKYLKKLTMQEARRLYATCKRREERQTPPPTHRSSSPSPSNPPPSPSNPPSSPSLLQMRHKRNTPRELTPFKLMIQTPCYKKFQKFNEILMLNDRDQYFFFQRTRKNMPEGERVINNCKAKE
jgi:hypothetical protein